jgi:PPOX class probable F420-dependent enzyme
VDRVEAERRVAAAPVARLGTIGPEGRVDLVPCTFALVGDRLVTAVDHKPKTTRRLRRLANIAADPRITLLVDHYDDDWDRLWWVRVRGRAEVVEAGPDRTDAVAALVAKYPQYAVRAPDGPAIVATVTDWTWWSATGRSAPPADDGSA